MATKRLPRVRETAKCINCDSEFTRESQHHKDQIRCAMCAALRKRVKSAERQKRFKARQ